MPGGSQRGPRFSNQFAHANAPPVRTAPPSATNSPVLAFAEACQLPDEDAMAQVAAQMMTIRAEVSRP